MIIDQSDVELSALERFIDYSAQFHEMSISRVDDAYDSLSYLKAHISELNARIADQRRELADNKVAIQHYCDEWNKIKTERDEWRAACLSHGEKAEVAERELRKFMEGQ